MSPHSRGRPRRRLRRRPDPRGPHADGRAAHPARRRRRRLDEDSDTRTLDLAASLARAAFELSCGAWQPLANLQTAVGALQCLCAPKKRGSASVLAIELAVYDDDEALPDVRSSDLATGRRQVLATHDAGARVVSGDEPRRRERRGLPRGAD